MKLILIAFLSLFFFYDCQIFESVGSISTSVNGVSTSSNSISKLSDSVQSISGSLQSISGSSSGGGKAQLNLYRMDVRDLTAFYFQSGFDNDYKTDLAQIARKNGILNWESDPSTYVGIGEGLKKANLSQHEFQVFLTKLSTDKQILKTCLTEGYSEKGI